MKYNLIVLIVIIALTLLMSVVSFALYGMDKKRAVSSKPRIKEKTLLAASVFFGSFGAFLGRIIHHHKTDKVYFSITIYLSMIAQIIVIAAAVYGAIAF